MQRAKSFHCILKLIQRKEMKKKCKIIYLHIKTNAKFENQCKEKKSD